MGEGLYRFLKWTAIALTAAWVLWAAYDNFLSGKQPGEYDYAAGERAFSDGNYEEALPNYEAALNTNPNFLPALAGRAQTLIMLGREVEAIETFDELIAAQPEVAKHYANRGIALDRLGRHEQALASYEKALSIDEEAGSGLTRPRRRHAGPACDHAHLVWFQLLTVRVVDVTRPWFGGRNLCLL